MNPLRRLLRRLRGLFRRRRLEREMDDELRFHLEMQAAANRAAGMDPDEAHYAARRQFGHLDGVREAMRDVRGWVWLEQLGRDFHFALRALARSRGFLVAAIPTLAFGIGLCTTIFSLVNPILFRPLPFPEPDRLVFLNQANAPLGIKSSSLAYADYHEWRKGNRTFADMGLFLAYAASLGGTEQPARIAASLVTPSLFPVLGVRPIVGRGFEAADARPEAPPVAVLSHSLWQKRYGADPGVVGRSIQLNGRSHTVIGVLPRGFSTPDITDVWTPLVISAPDQTRGNHMFQGIGRLKPEVTLDQAHSDLALISERMAQAFPETNRGFVPHLLPLREVFLKSDLRDPCWALLGAVGFVLAVACANAANLFLARALGRQKEFAVRAAFGATRWRRIRQLLTEGALIAAAAGVLGLLCSYAGVRLVLALVPIEIPPWLNFRVDWGVTAFSAGVSLLTCLLFALAPAWRVSLATGQECLEESTHGTRESRHKSRLRALLVAGEVALATLLLCGAGLMFRTIRNLRRMDTGFEPRQLAVCSLDLPAVKYDTPEKRAAFYRAFLQKLGALPGVESVAAVSALPIRDRGNFSVFCVDGRPAPEPGAYPNASIRAVTPGYFDTMKIPLLQGREFTAADRANGAGVIIIDTLFARQFFPDVNPLGQHLKWGAADPTTMEIVGVVGDVKPFGWETGDPQPAFYLPHAQCTFSQMTVVARLAGTDFGGFALGFRQSLRALDPALPSAPLASMEEVVRQSFWQRRLLAQLVGVFSALALALTAVGIAGMIAYTVAQRTHEIGVRIALGARETDVIRLVMRQGLNLAVIGLIIGLLASTGLTRLLLSQLYAVNPLDPATLAASACLLGAVALLACYLPARRAARVDPLTALHDE